MKLPRAIAGPSAAWLWTVLAACTTQGRAPAASVLAGPVDGGSGRVLLHEDGFEVRLDTTRVEREADGSYRLHFETRHAHQRMAGDRPFNRGHLELLVRCDPLGFKTVSQVLSLNDGPAVFRQASALAALADSAWKPAPTGSIDARFLRAACAALGPSAAHRLPRE
jgi:hypothetical protein